ncbi:hypothetical protein [uncultured Clostridium sp.]|uniref:hypothetical protein n=1 Tax=uncultured Clostridium sp. TaxID=59620 RepID=UPI0026F3DC92|nr:hypothetical protein [uncultured Clostridium sp.]
MVGLKLVGLVNISDTVTIVVINKNTNQIASINHFPDTNNLASIIYSSLQGIGLEELYIGFDTETVTSFKDNAYSIGSFHVGTMQRHSVLSMDDLRITQNIARTLGVRTVKIFDYITLFKSLSNDKNTVFLENTRDGVRAVHVFNGQIKDFRTGVTTESVKSTVKLSNAEVKKLFDISFANTYGIGLINFDMLTDKYKKILVPILFMLYAPPCLELNPYGVLPQSNCNLETEPRRENPREMKEVRTEPRRENPRVQEPVQQSQQVVPSYPRNKNWIGNIAGIIGGIIIGVSIAATTQLPKQNLILMDSLQTMASTSNDVENTSSYYSRLIEGMTNPERSNSTILSRISSITEGGTIAGVTLKKNNVEVLVLVDSEPNLEVFKSKLGEVVTIQDTSNVGVVSLGETTMTKYKIYCKVV